MKRVGHLVYYQHFRRKDQTLKAAFAIIMSVFMTVIWANLLLSPMGSTFGELLVEKTAEDGTVIREVGGTGLAFGFWFVVVGIAQLVAMSRLLYLMVILRDIKREERLTSLEVVYGLRIEKEEEFNELFMMAAILLTAFGLPLLYLIPTDFSNALRLFALYFLTFLTLSTYGLRNEWLDRRSVRQQQKEKRKKEKKKKKEGVKKEGKNPTIQAMPSIERILHQSLAEKEYQLPYFAEQVEAIVQEIRLLNAYSENTTVEDVHLIERILKEEIPAVLVTYDELDEEGKQAYQAKLQTSLQKIQGKLIQRNKGKQEIKKLGAEKVIEILETRY